MIKVSYNSNTRRFSIERDSEYRTFSMNKSFSDWDQIRDLVNDQLPNGVIKVSKVRGSDNGKSYKVVYKYKGGKESKPIEVPINGKSALDNYNKATNSKIENTSKPTITEDTKNNYKLKKNGVSKEDIELINQINGKSKSKLSYSDQLRKFRSNKDNLSPEVLDALANSDSSDYREIAANSKSTSKEALHKLITDKDEFNVANAARLNPNLSDKDLDYVSENYPNLVPKNASMKPEHWIKALDLGLRADSPDNISSLFRRDNLNDKDKLNILKKIEELNKESYVDNELARTLLECRNKTNDIKIKDELDNIGNSSDKYKAGLDSINKITKLMESNPTKITLGDLVKAYGLVTPKCYVDNSDNFYLSFDNDYHINKFKEELNKMIPKGYVFNNIKYVHPINPKYYGYEDADINSIYLEKL